MVSGFGRMAMPIQPVYLYEELGVLVILLTLDIQTTVMEGMVKGV
jgi:hypothetical protein